jgi:hypothetical protein
MLQNYSFSSPDKFHLCNMVSYAPEVHKYILNIRLLACFMLKCYYDLHLCA